MAQPDQLMLSISGLRGVVGSGPSGLTPQVAARFAAAFASWLRQTTGSRAPHIVLGRDSRPSGPMIEQAAADALTGIGCRITMLGIVATPTAAIMVRHLGADGGLVVTASHNPAEWNGVKPLRHDGQAPTPEQAAAIIERFRSGEFRRAGTPGPPSADPQPGRRDDHNETANRVHVQRILSHIDAAAIHHRRPKVVLDSACGAGGPAAAMLLRELGAELVHLHAEPTGRFPHPPEPLREHLGELCDAVRRRSADIGFAQDPDADRLAVVDERGRYIGEEYTLALCALHVLGRDTAPGSGGTGILPVNWPAPGSRGRGPAPDSDRGAGVVANLSTSRMIDDVAARFGRPVHRTPVGEANVAERMRQTNAVIGGEGNGGVIWPPVVYVRDSLAGMALLLEMLALDGRPLSRIVADLPAYAIVKDKLPIEPGMAERATAGLQRRYAGRKLDLQDGLRIDLPDGWVHVRPSNTEPILRLIAEAGDADRARALIEEVRRAAGAGSS